MKKDARVYVAGRDNLIGSALIRQLEQQGYTKILSVDGAEPDLHDNRAVDRFFAEASPEYVFVAAGNSGGISANQKYPADLMLDNLLSAANIIRCAYEHDITKLLYLASSCTYPRLAEQPMHPSTLMSGPLEPTNESYAVAKLAGLKLCEAYQKQYGANFITGIPANPFGIGDDFSPEDSHVIGALLRRMYEAKQQGLPSIDIWGSGQARREFIFADDLADACIFVMNQYEDREPLNIGSGIDYSIKELAYLIQEVVGFEGTLVFDTSKPDGMPMKILDTKPLHEMGWKSKVDFKTAIEMTYQSFLQTLHEDDPFYV